MVVDLQRRLHRIPELAFQEQETTALVREFLAARGVAFDSLGGDTGGAAVIGEGDPCVILRADMDALPVTEEGGGPHCSCHAGVMHACGHDAHTAMLLAVADALSSGAVSSGDGWCACSNPPRSTEGAVGECSTPGCSSATRPGRRWPCTSGRNWPRGGWGSLRGR